MMRAILMLAVLASLRMECVFGDERFCEMASPSKVYCGGTKTGDSGQILSPGFEEHRNIREDLTCEWRISVPDMKVVELTFDAFTLEQGSGYLEIHDSCPYGYMNANLTGSNVSSPIITTTNRVSLVFYSSGLKSGDWFSIRFQAVPPPHFQWKQRNHGVTAPIPKKGSISLTGALDVGVQLVSIATDITLNTLDGQQGDQQHQQLVNLMNQLKDSIDNLSNQINQQSITAELHHEEEIASIKYYEAAQSVRNYLDTLTTRLSVTTNGTLQPESLAQDWTDSMLRQDTGINPSLNTLYDMIMGSSSVLHGRPLMETYSDLLQNLPTSEYRTKLQNEFNYIMDIQSSGYAAWILALKHKEEEDQINEVRRRGYAKLSEQNCLVAPLFYDWPSGTYGLPKPTSGCPVGWEDGRHEYNSFDLQNHAPVHFSESLSNTTLVLGYCMKTNPSEDDYIWPKGSYCILKKGDCPVDFCSGRLWLPGGNEAGVVPDGSSDGGSIEMGYCCQDRGFASNPIRLPPRTPFYLLRYGGECQQVEKMDVVEEWVEYKAKGNVFKVGVTPDDDGDDNSHKLYYCFYSVSNIGATPIISAAAVPRPANMLNFVIACVMINGLAVLL